MANNQYVNKLVVNGVTKLDLSGDTITADKLASGYTAHDASGAPITGTGSVGKIIISDTQDANGGTIRTISTADEIYLGTKTIDQNGTYSASSDNLDGYSSVTVNVPSGGATLQTKSVTPSESSQTVTPDTGYDGLSSVSVGAISSSYVGTGVSRKSSSDLTSSGATVTAPAGYYESAATKTIASGSATVNETLTPTPSISVSSSGLITASINTTVGVTPSVTAGYIESGTLGSVTVRGSNTSQLTTKAAATITPGTTDQTIAAGTYLTGAQTISGDADLVAGNIKKDVQIFGVTGTYEGSGGSTKNIQAYIGRASRTANSYGATDVTLTVAKTGTYNVSWTAWRSSSSGTMGTNLHRNSTSGTNKQTWTSTYGQQIELTNQSYTVGDVLTLYATSGSNSRTINVANLIIEEQ